MKTPQTIHTTILFLACSLFEKHLTKQGGRNVKNIGGTCGGCNLLPTILLGIWQITVNLMETGGAYYAQHITAFPPPSRIQKAIYTSE